MPLQHPLMIELLPVLTDGSCGTYHKSDFPNCPFHMKIAATGMVGSNLCPSGNSALETDRETRYAR